ncbi:hypothetical protein [Pseudomonas sp. 28 E 9]|nr:hypothetical protein [Pseudomonas sp. 28 E 9]
MPLELAHELFQVVLHDAVQRYEVAVDIVENFNRRSLWTHEVKRGAASKDLDITFVWWKKLN